MEDAVGSQVWGGKERPRSGAVQMVLPASMEAASLSLELLYGNLPSLPKNFCFFP